MSKVALVVTIESEPNAREEILRALLAHRGRCLKEEPGTLQFEVLVPEDDPERIFLFELYADSNALSAHSGGTSIARFRRDVEGKIRKSATHKCMPVTEL